MNKYIFSEIIQIKRKDIYHNANIFEIKFWKKLIRKPNHQVSIQITNVNIFFFFNSNPN